MTESATTPDAMTMTPSAGQRLRQAREAAGLHVVALAAMLKVPVKKLEALEAERYDQLPDTTFTRALALSVCRQLKVDPTDILAALPQSSEVRLGEGPNLGAPFKASGPAAAQAAAPASLPRPVIVAALVLLAAALVWFLVPERPNGAARVTTNGNGAVMLATPVPVPVAEATAPVTGEVASAGNPASSGSQPAMPVSPLATTETTAPAEPRDDSSAPAEGTRDAAAAVLDIRVSEISWVEVVGRSGRVLLQREMGAGEQARFDQDGPFKVVVGRADATEVRVRGQALDIAPHARNNVARFEVK